ncbi:transposase family protein [Nocardia sp. NEAU-G5]|uniref:Transposase family protein n=1 Tax=Nocardia albiluteola TaxID=2842303 RepID=A0ABS6BCS8_9NOCA|nr:transposase family protein [Nocardia albiluteola]MBU3068094.1 transposase family protein [Nocardia albiluteola]
MGVIHDFNDHGFAALDPKWSWGRPSKTDMATREPIGQIARCCPHAPGWPLVAELEKVFAVAGGPPRAPRMDNGLEMISHALQQFCADHVGIVYIPPDPQKEQQPRGTRPPQLTRTSGHTIVAVADQQVCGSVTTGSELGHSFSSFVAELVRVGWGRWEPVDAVPR